MMIAILAEHARYKVWVRPNGEMPFLYGSHILKAHVGRWSEDCPEHQGVVSVASQISKLLCSVESYGCILVGLRRFLVN